MTEFIRPIQLRWSDLDPNFHLRHSIYYDLGAQIRTEFITSNGLTPAVMSKEHFGPILFREEALFKREIHFGDELTMSVMASKLREDYSRFSMRHELKRGDQICAILNVDGAWMDTQTRKLTIPPQVGVDMIEAMPRTDDFEWV